MIDIIHTLSQFSKLGNDVKNLPRVTRDVVINGPGSLDEEQTVGDAHLKVAGDASGYKAAGASSVGSGSDHSYPGRVSTCTHNMKLLGSWLLPDNCMLSRKLQAVLGYCDWVRVKQRLEEAIVQEEMFKKKCSYNGLTRTSCTLTPKYIMKLNGRGGGGYSL